MKPDVSVLIVNWNTRDLLLECLESVFASKGRFSLQVIVVDNGSSDGSADAAAARFPSVEMIRNARNMGFGAANNAALARAGGRIALFLNNDALLNPAALEGLVDFLDRTDSAACAVPQLLHRDGSLQNSFDNFPTLASELLNKWMLRLLLPGRFPSKRVRHEAPAKVEAPLGACMAAKKKVLDEVGGFDERFFFFLEETDLCLRIRESGRDCFFLPGLSVVHGKGQTKASRPARAWIEYYRSNYAFFAKHRSPAARFVLRSGKMAKLAADLVLTALAFAATLGLARRPRRKLPVYAALLWWHLRLCPAGAGLAIIQEADREPPAA